MKAKEAFSKFKSQYPDLTATSIYEYDSCYVFNVATVEPTDDLSSLEFDTLYAVSKDDGTVQPFNPFDISIEEYDVGVQVDMDSMNESSESSNSWVSIGQSWVNRSLDAKYNP